MRSYLVPLGGLVFAACSQSLPHPPYTPQAESALVLVDLPPPPGRAERIPAKPAGADAWVDGEWILRRGRWYWLLGRWVKTPAAARYSPWVLVRASDASAYYAPSVWKDAKGAVLPSPAGLAFATANGSAVYDAAGEVENTGRAIKSAPTPQPESQDRPGQ